MFTLFTTRPWGYAISYQNVAFLYIFVSHMITNLYSLKIKNKSRQYYNISLIYQYYDIKWLHRILVLMLYETDEKIEKHIDVAIFHNISNEIYIIYDIGIEHWCSICLKIWDFFFSSVFIWGRSFNDPTTSIRLCNKCNTGKHSNAMLLFLVSMDIGICTLRILMRYDAIV